ncbi:hypothetical protein ACHAXN_010644 [Cyclotella atomus]
MELPLETLLSSIWLRRLAVFTQCQVDNWSLGWVSPRAAPITRLDDLSVVWAAGRGRVRVGRAAVLPPAVTEESEFDLKVGYSSRR